MIHDPALFDALRATCPQLHIVACEPLSRHTSFRIGGAVDCMAFPQDAAQLAALLRVCAHLCCVPRILGAGTNVLAPDDGLSGVVICTREALLGLTRDECCIHAMAGETLARVAVFAREQGLAGLEFAHGIPGTVGGGVYMNAGAYGGEIAQVCTEVTAMLPDGTLQTFCAQELHFGYRTSIFETLPCVIVSAKFRLTPDDPEAIRARMRQLQKKRRDAQPLDQPSAGSAFKRPQNGYAAALIDEAGLRGAQIGGAAVSEKHAGFVINRGGATARDVRALLEEIQKQVHARSGVMLQPEIRIW